MVSRTHLLGTLAVAGMFITAPVHAVQLHDAAEMGDVEEVKRLIAQGVDVNAAANNGATALMLASLEGHGEIVNLLVSNGADVNAADNDGVTALIMASQQGHGEIVNLLLTSGADVNAATNSGVTAIGIAGDQGHPDIFEMLARAGSVLSADQLASTAAQATIGLAALALKQGVLQGLAKRLGHTTTIRADNPMPIKFGSGMEIDVSGKKVEFRNGSMTVSTESNVINFSENAHCIVDGVGYVHQGGEWFLNPLTPRSSARPDEAVTLDCFQSFERAYPDQSRLPPYHRLQELDVRPARISGPMPQYPVGLRSQGIEGTVEWAFLMLPNGRTAYPVLRRTSHPGFVDLARDVILGTRFTPGEMDGLPVATLGCMTIEFSIR